MRLSGLPGFLSDRLPVAQSVLERLKEAGLTLLAFALVVVGLPLLDAGADTPGLEVSLVSDPVGAVRPGDQVVYSYQVFNGTGEALSALELDAQLPDGLTAVETGVPSVVRAFDLVAADDFTGGGFDGSTGSHPWTGPWQEFPESDGPAEGLIQTGLDRDIPVVVLRGNGSQLSRTVDLTGFPARLCDLSDSSYQSA